MASMRSIRAIAAGARRRSRCPQGDQAHRAVAPDRSRPAVLDLEPGQAGRLLGRRGGGRGHQPRAAARAAARGGCLVSTPEDLQGLQRSRLRGQAGPRLGALRDRRRPRRARPRRPDRRGLPGRVRAAEPPTASRPAMGQTCRMRRRAAPAPAPAYTRPHGVRHLLAAYDLSRDRLYGHIETRKGRTELLAFCRYIRSLYPPEVRLAFVLDNSSPHLTTKTDGRVGDWATANNVEFAYVPFYASWLNRIEAQFTGLRYFATSPGETATPATATSAASSTRPTLPDTALAAAILMTRVYEEMMLRNRDPPSALRHAQVWLRELREINEQAFLNRHPGLEQELVRRLATGSAPGRRGATVARTADPHNCRPYEHPDLWAPFVAVGA